MTTFYPSYGLEREMDAIDHLVNAPAVQPLDLDLVKTQREFTGIDALDTLFDLWIGAATDFWEGQTGQQLITATWERWMPCFPCQRRIELPHPPLLTVVSVKYYAADGTDTTFNSSNYTVIAPMERNPRRGQLWLNDGSSWPTALCRPGSVRIRYTAGYGAAPGDVPDQVRMVLLTLVGHYHRFREAVEEAQRTVLLELPMGAREIMTQAKQSTVPQLPKPSQFWTGTSWVA